MAVLLPLSFLRRLDSLRHTSYVALFAVGKLPRLACARPTEILHSLSRNYCCRVLCSSTERNHYGWTRLYGALHTQFYIYISGAGFRVHVRTERAPQVSCPSRVAH